MRGYECSRTQFQKKKKKKKKKEKEKEIQKRISKTSE